MLNITIANLFHQLTNLTHNSTPNTSQIEMKCNVPRNSSLSKIKCLSTFMCQRNWIAVAIATKQKTKEINSTIKCPNRLSTISNVSNMNYESSDYKLSPRLKWKKLLRLNYNRKLQTFNHALIPQNANFHNSTSCRTFAEVKTCQDLY